MGRIVRHLDALVRYLSVWALAFIVITLTEFLCVALILGFLAWRMYGGINPGVLDDMAPWLLRYLAAPAAVATPWVVVCYFLQMAYAGYPRVDSSDAAGRWRLLWLRAAVVLAVLDGVLLLFAFVLITGQNSALLWYVLPTVLSMPIAARVTPIPKSVGIVCIKLCVLFGLAGAGIMAVVVSHSLNPAPDSGARTLPAHGENVNAMVFLPDSRTLISAGDHGVMRYWDVNSGRPTRMRNVGADVWWIGLPDNGVFIATAGDNIPITFWRTKDDQKLWSITGQKDQALSSDGRLLATVDASENVLHLWNVKSRRIVHNIAGKYGDGKIAFSPDSRLLAAQAEKGIGIWRTDTWRPVRFAPTVQDATSLAFAPRRAALAVGTGEGAITIYSANSDRTLARLSTQGEVTAITFSPGGALMVTCSGSDTDSCVIWETRGWRRVRSLPFDCSVSSVAFSPDGAELAASPADGSILLWPMKSKAG